MARYICKGAGYFDLDYKVTRSESINGKWKVVWTCKCYDIWKSMIHRCYAQRNSAYSKVEVCVEWRTFSNFKKWYDQNHVDGLELDKDLKTLGSNKIYSPETCCFVPSKVNNFLVGCDDFTNDSKGVYFDQLQTGLKKYKAQINDLGKGMIHLGWFETKQEAHIQYLKHKCKQSIILANECEDDEVRKLLLNVSKYLKNLIKSKENI